MKELDSFKDKDIDKSTATISIIHVGNIDMEGTNIKAKVKEC